MKSGAPQAKTVILTLIVFVNLALAAQPQPFPLYLSPNNSSAGTNVEGKSMVLQPIEMNRVPLGVAIQQLARQARMNIIFDDQLWEWWGMTGYFGRAVHPEPVLTFRWTDITPKRALQRLLQEQGMVLVEDPQTFVAQVTFTNHVVTIAPLDTNIFGNDQPLVPGNDPAQIPLIEFEDVPLTVALENLARQADFNYVLDPQIGYNQPDKDGQIKPEPVISCYWENITAKQGLMALLKKYGFTVSKDPASPVLLVRAKNHPVHFVDVTLLGNDTNVIPLIKFEGVPLTFALVNLAQQAKINYLLDPNIGYGQEDKDGNIKIEPTVNIRWENLTARQAFISLCENYNFIFIKNPATDVIRIKSDE
ncbi:MAG TPA: hypothetical protein VMH87_14750 [Pseudomonadales bacterium]|nr:hypothetical protein [Pseudomonadales bacterium]